MLGFVKSSFLNRDGNFIGGNYREAAADWITMPSAVKHAKPLTKRLTAIEGFGLGVIAFI